MNDGVDENDKGSLFALFEGEIEGEVRNRVTGNVHHRRGMMNHYRYLLLRSVNDPANIALRKIVRMVADMLDIPEDIHESLIKEAWKRKDSIPADIPDPLIKADIEAMYNALTGEVFFDYRKQTRLKEETSGENDEEIGLFDNHSGVMDDSEVETYSLLSEMEEDDISMKGGTSMLETEKDSPFKSEGWGRRREGSCVGDHASLRDLRKDNSCS